MPHPHLSVTFQLLGESFRNAFRNRKIWLMLIANQFLFAIILTAIWVSFGGGEIFKVRNFFQDTETSALLRWAAACREFGSILFWLLAGVMLYSEIIRIWNCQHPSWFRGWKHAFRNLPPIFCWALFTFGVNSLLGFGAESASPAVRICVCIAKCIWTIFMVFVIPVLARENTSSNPVANIRQSMRLFLRVWREILLESVIQIVLIYLTVSLIAGILFPAVIWGYHHEDVRHIAGAIVFSGGGVLMWLGMSCLYLIHSYFLCGTYLFASEGVPPSAENSENLL